MKDGIPMEIIIDKYNKYNKALEKTKVKYQEAIRGRDYQDELYSQDKYSIIMDIDDLVFRRKTFQTEICLLEDIFGVIELNKE